MNRLKWLGLCGILVGAMGLASAASDTMVAPLTAVQMDALFPLPNSTQNTLYNAWAEELLYKPLIWFSQKTAQPEWNRSIAESVTVSNGGKTFTVKLNPKWHWSDGTPVTSEDVLFTWDLINADCNSPHGSGTFAACGQGGLGAPGNPPVPTIWKSVKALGPYEVQVTISEPRNENWFIANGLGLLTPIPKHYFDKYPGQYDKTYLYWVKNADNVPLFQKAPVDGPFMVKSLVRSQAFTFVANPNYDGHKPTYKTLIFRYFTTSDAEFNALRAGELQVGGVPFHLASEAPHLPGYTFYTTPNWGFNYIYVNFANPLRNGPAVRELVVRAALQYAVNQPAIAKVIFHGYGYPQYAPVPLRPLTKFVSPILAVTNPYPYNPALGKQLLEKAGWHLVNGVMTKGHLKLEFTLYYSSGSTSQQQESELIQEAAAKEGIKLTLKPEPFDTLIGDLSNPKSWTLMFYGGVAQGVFPSMHGIFACDSGFNQQGYCDKTADELMTRAIEYFPTQEQTYQAFYAAENYLAQQLPVIYLPSAYSLNERANNVGGVIEHSGPFAGEISPQYWYYK